MTVAYAVVTTAPVPVVMASECTRKSHVGLVCAQPNTMLVSLFQPFRMVCVEETTRLVWGVTVYRTVVKSMIGVACVTRLPYQLIPAPLLRRHVLRGRLEMNAMSVLKTRSGRTIKLRDPAQNGCDVVLVSAALLAHNRRRREKVYRGRANDRV